MYAYVHIYIAVHVAMQGCVTYIHTFVWFIRWLHHNSVLYDLLLQVRAVYHLP